MSKGFVRLAATFAGAAAVALSLAGSQPGVSAAATPGTLFAITRSQLLVKVDPATGSLTQLAGLFPNCSGNCPLDSQSSELASDPTTHRLFAIRTNSFSFNFPPVFTQELLTIDSQTGAILSNPLFTRNAPHALAFDTSSHTLFGFTGSSIVKVEAATAALTPFAAVGGNGPFVSQMALSSSAHTIYISQESVFLPAPPNPTQVFAVDINTGGVAPPVTLDRPVRWIVTDGASLLGVTDLPATSVVAINTSTGATTMVAGLVSGNSQFVPTGPTSDPTTHTIFVDVSIFGNLGMFQDDIFSVNDQSGGTRSSFLAGFNNLTGLVFEAPPQITAQSIEDDVRAALASGAIDNAGIANSLLAKLDAAADARASAAATSTRTNGCNTAANIYQAFINEVQAQSSATASSTRGPIAAATASQLITEAQFLIANCP